MGSPGINDGSRFLVKSNPLQTRPFFTSIAQWNVEEDDKITRKVAKGKGKTRGKDGKTGKGAEEQDNESTYSFQSYDSKRLFMFLYQGWYLHEEKEISFLTACLANFSSTGTSLIEILTPAWSSASTSHFHKGIFFFS